MPKFGLRRRLKPTINRPRSGASYAPRRMSRRGRRAPRKGTHDMWSGVTDAEMQRVAGLQRARENRAQALKKLAAKNPNFQIRGFAYPNIQSPNSQIRVSKSPKMKLGFSKKVPSASDAKGAEWRERWQFHDVEDGRNFPPWVQQRLNIWDDPKRRGLLLKRSGRYALSKFFWDEGLDPAWLVDWAKDNPSLTDKHVAHIQSTFQELGHRSFASDRLAFRGWDDEPRPGEWRRETQREADDRVPTDVEIEYSKWLNSAK